MAIAARSATAVRLVAIVALVAGLVGASAMTAEAITRPRMLYHEHPVGTGVVDPGFPIDHVGVVFDLPPGEDVHHEHSGDGHHEGTEELSVRFRVNGRWGPWQHVIEDGAQAEGTFTGALVPGNDADAYQVRGVPPFARNARAAALNTTDGPQEVVGYRQAHAAEAVTSCKSRADWGADESLRSSDRSYAPIQLMTVHHTATQNDDPDPDARVRAIYGYHTQTNGWDDIGYQALISEDGTVYEGRWSGSDSPSCLTGGGTGWEFGHHGTAATADMVTGAHTGGYNTGNFGVALLGTFTDLAPKAAARDALVEYLAELADRHGLDPEGTVDYDNGVNATTTDTINGHQDFTATECPGGTLYADLPSIRTDVTSALAANSAPVVTITDPSTSDSTTVEESSADAGATLTFAATATDESSTLGWQWTDANGSQIADTASFTTTLPVGTYAYTATATDPEGLSGTDTITVEVVAYGTAPTHTDAVASGEQPVAGTVSGTYLDTTVDDGTTESITEVEYAKGPPTDRYSYLEHVWIVPVPSGGSTVTLFVTGSATSSSDADDFAFDYSLDQGQTYTRALLFPAGTSGTYSASLPSTTSGDVQVRVRDTDRTKGARTLDRISVEHLYIRTDSTTTTSAPSAPTTVSATATSSTTVDVTWTDVDGEDGYELGRGTDSDGDGILEWAAVGSFAPDVTSHADSGLSASTTYAYRVRASNSAGSSDWTVSDDVTTPSATGISLDAAGYKVKGRHHVDLTWSGATNVRVYRDGVELADVSGTTWTDATGGTGKSTYTHQVCALDGNGEETGTCSEEVTTTFS